MLTAGGTNISSLPFLGIGFTVVKVNLYLAGSYFIIFLPTIKSRASSSVCICSFAAVTVSPSVEPKSSAFSSQHSYSEVQE